MERTYPAKDENLDEVLEFVETMLKDTGLLQKEILQVMVAIEEAFVNIAHYAYRDSDGKVKFIIDLDKSGKSALFCFKDSGIPFNPLDRPDPDVNLPSQAREIGGLGIYMIRKIMDDVSYRYENGENILTMIKNI